MQKRPLTFMHSFFYYFLMALLVLFGYQFSLSLQASIIWPAFGFAFALILTYEKKVLIPIGLGMLSGYLLYNVVMNPSSLLSYIYAFVLSINTLAILTLAVIVFKKLRKPVFVTFYNLMVLLGIFMVVSLYSAFSSNLFIYFIGYIDASEFLDSLIVWFFGDFFSLIIFGLTVSPSLENDDTSITFFMKDKVGRHEIMFYAFLALFAFLMFNDYLPFVDYSAFKYLFIPFAIYGAYHFQHRAFYIGALIFLMFFTLWPPIDFLNASRFYMLFDINLFLTFIAVLYFTLQLLFKGLEKERCSLNETNERLNDLFQSIDSLFGLSDTVIEHDDETLKKQAIKMFHTIFNLFSGIDYGSCVFVKDNHITWIDAVGYDVKLLNQLRSNAHDFKGKLNKPLKIEHAEEWIKTDFGKTYENHAKRHPKIKETVLMSVNISKDFIYEMSFDIDANSDKSFSESIMKYFESLNNLLNGFYETQILSDDYNDKQNAMVLSLLDMIELFDENTSVHSLDVAMLCFEIGKSFELDTSTINKLYWAGIMHDIGKIGIPNSIVNKPSKLTIQEYETIKKHVYYSYQLLNHSKVLKPIAQLVYTHHERYDGNGYPEGINDQSLNLEDYILSISEAIAAMARDSTYQPRKSVGEINEILKQEANKAWPDYVVSNVLVLIEEGLLDHFKDENTKKYQFKNA